MARTIAQDHDAKRRAILKAAAEVFATEGYDRASMNRVAAAAGISKANIYHYYEGKDALLFDLLDAYLSALRDRVAGLDLAGLSPRERLLAITTELLLAYRGMDHEHQLQAQGIPVLPAARQEVLKGYQRDLVGLMAETLKAAAPEAFGDDRRRLRAATMSVFGMLNWFYMWNAGAGAAERRDYARLVTDLTLGGLPALAR